MKTVQIQFNPWDKIYNFDPVDSALKIGDYAVVKTEIGMEIGKVVGFKDLPSKRPIESGHGLAKSDSLDKRKKLDKQKNGIGQEYGAMDRIKPILRKATTIDLEKISDQKQKKEAMDYCEKMINKYHLFMKLADVHFSFDGSRVTFAFIANGRIDFRELVKDLTRHFSRTVRLQQIGIRDEAKIIGDYGHCGRPLCCGRFLKNLSSINSGMAELQQVAHRGSERISGICGRLMCCLAYEHNNYEKLAKELPAIGARVDVNGRKGVIVGHHILKQSVDVKFPPEGGEKRSAVIEVDLNRNKNKQPQIYGK
ncbi:MAG: regulatory iron-sulfur-containing complex subunit RicT [Patescibacteria group bacterium]|nr:regulatory iron-sulfur-containing complex subunit RicT [Patescibacteria group bacterium]